MKKFTKISVVALLAFGVCAFAIARVHLSGGRGPFTSGEALVTHLSEAYPRFAAFDLNKDGRFDEVELQSVSAALASGSLQIPAPHNPHGTVPSPESMLSHIGQMYSQCAAFDRNHDGSFDLSEQAAIKAAFNKGELAFPGAGGPLHH
jgi:hypothetical protein